MSAQAVTGATVDWLSAKANVAHRKRAHNTPVADCLTANLTPNWRYFVALAPNARVPSVFSRQMFEILLVLIVDLLLTVSNDRDVQIRD